jgi:tRNA splicing ligase
MVRSSNRVVDLECELDRARTKLREDQLELAEAIKLLGMPLDVIATIQSRRET